MKNRIHSLVFVVSIILIVIACGKVTDEYEGGKIDDYVALEPGKYIIYQLDSTIALPFGTGFIVHGYQVKDVVDAPITDNLNRPGWRIVRYIRDSLGKDPWTPSETYSVINTGNTLEVVENNLRSQKLTMPIREGFTWKGNSYMQSSPFYTNSIYSQWEFVYKDIGKGYQSDSFDLSNTITVVQFDSTTNTPFYDRAYHMYSKGYEIYAKGLGLIYKDIFDREYQVFYDTRDCMYISCNNNLCDTVKCDQFPNLCDSLEADGKGTMSCADTLLVNAYYAGHGVKMRMIGHN